MFRVKKKKKQKKPMAQLPGEFLISWMTVGEVSALGISNFLEEISSLSHSVVSSISLH